MAKDLERKSRSRRARDWCCGRGRRQSPIVHALTAAINHHLDAVVSGVTYYNDPARDLKDAGDYANLTALAKALSAGEVETLVIIGSNPVYTAPGDLGFGKLLDKAKTIVVSPTT